MDCDSDGSKSNPEAYPNYYPWWETYPNNSIQYFKKYLPLQPGDLVVASVGRGTVSGEVIMNLSDFGADNTPKLEWSISKKLNNTTVPSIAECIVEKPNEGPMPPPNGVYTENNDNPQDPLTNFGTIEFPAKARSSIEQGCRVGQNGDFSTLSSYDYQAISQTSQTYVTNYSLFDQYSGASLDQTSQPSYDGSYQVNWLQGGTTPQLKP